MSEVPLYTSMRQPVFPKRSATRQATAARSQEVAIVPAEFEQLPSRAFSCRPLKGSANSTVKNLERRCRYRGYSILRIRTALEFYIRPMNVSIGPP